MSYLWIEKIEIDAFEKYLNIMDFYKVSNHPIIATQQVADMSSTEMQARITFFLQHMNSTAAKYY